MDATVLNRRPNLPYVVYCENATEIALELEELFRHKEIVSIIQIVHEGSRMLLGIEEKI